MAEAVELVGMVTARDGEDVYVGGDTWELMSRLIEADPTLRLTAFTLENEGRKVTVGPAPVDEDSGGNPQ